MDSDSREVIGSSGFKIEPSEEGIVEMAHFTYPEFEGQGFATSMAKRLIELAASSAAGRKVIAHTLPEPTL